jgi:hypothetical protein
MIQQATKNTPEVQQTLDMLGLDPFHDLERLTLALVNEERKDGGVLILHGHFDTARFHQAARQLVKQFSDRLTIHKEEDLKYYAVEETGKHGSILFGTGVNKHGAPLLNMQVKGCLLDAFAGDCLALVDKNTLVVASSEALLRETCKHIKDHDATALNKPMRRLLAEVESKQTIVVAFLGSEPAVETATADNVSETQEEIMPSALRDLTGSIAITEDFKLRCALRATTIGDARDIMKGLEGARLRIDGLMTLLAGSRKEYTFLKEVPHAFTAVRKGSVILVEGHLSAETLGKILATIEGKTP